MSYDEKFMHAQNNPKYAGVLMRPSSQTIGAKGCFISCLTYLRSRKENKDYQIPDIVNLMGDNGGFTAQGDTKWDVVEKVLHLKISKLAPWYGKVFTMRNVWVRGHNNQMFSHWVTELSGNLMYDPLWAGHQFVRPIDFYPPVFSSYQNINKRYIK